MNQQAKRIKELFGYARTLTKEQGIGTMCVRAAGFFKRRFFGKRARYWPSKNAVEAETPAQRPRGGNLPHHFYFNAAVQYAAKLFNRISR